MSWSRSGLANTYRHPAPLDRVEHGRTIGARWHDHRPSGEQRRQHGDPEAAHACERRGRERDVRRSDGTLRHHLDHVPQHVPVREDHALGETGRAGRVREDRQVVGRRLPRRDASVHRR